LRAVITHTAAITSTQAKNQKYGDLEHGCGSRGRQRGLRDLLS